MSVRFSVLSGFAFRALRANKMRSFLTMLGIIIGVASVIIMISLGQGVQDQIMSRFSSMGANILTVSTGGEGQRASGTSGVSNPITLQDAEAISKISGVAQIAPSVRTSLKVTSGTMSWTTSIIGTGEAYAPMSSLKIQEGRFLTDADITGSASVAVLGPTAYQNLMNVGVSPVGREIRINGISFRVIGLLQPLASSGDVDDRDDAVYIPVTTAQIRLMGISNQAVNSLQVQCTSSDVITTVQNDIKALMRKRHHLSETQDDDFRIRNMAQLLSEAQSVTTIMTMFLAGIAAISLVVGGIGIMNIMLVSVTERTREIGVRMAIGANRIDILAQFLYEAILLSLAGCLLGIGLGIGGGQIFASVSGYNIPVSFYAISLAVGFSSIVGIVFGYYPAHRASRLNPAEALSFE